MRKSIALAGFRDVEPPSDQPGRAWHLIVTLLLAAILSSPASVARAQAVDDPDRSSQDTASRQDTADHGNLSDLALEDLINVKVYAASRFVQDAAQAPASVTVVGAEEIRRHGYRTLADILRSVRGFYVTYDRNYSYVGVRGFLRPGDYNGRVLLLVNGHRLNDAIFEQALLGTESPVDVSLFDRVEVIRGPSSSLYGTSAFFAVVNVITRGGRSIDGTEVEVEAGSQQVHKARVAAGGRNRRGWDGLISVNAFESRGNDRLYYPEFDDGVSGGFAIDADRDRGAGIFTSGTAGNFTAQVGFGSRTKHIPTAAFDTLFNDPRAETTDRRGFADLEYTRRLSPRTSLEVRGGYDYYDYDGAFPYDTGMFYDGARGSWLTGEGLFNHQIGPHALTFGTEQRLNLRQDQSASDETGVLLDDRRESQVAAVFVEDEYRLHPRVIVNAGLRWDQYFGVFGGTLNPRLALIVVPAARSTVKMLYGRAFRAPNPFELYYDQSPSSEHLQPERIETFELAWEQRLSPRLQLTATAFRSGVRDLITQRNGSEESIDGLYYFNGNNVTADGIELELQGELPGRTHARVAQVFQAATLDSSGSTISNSPRVLTTLVIDAPIPRTQTVLAFNGYFIGERLRAISGVVDGAFVGNLSLARQLPVHGLGIGLTIYNVFDADYGDPGSVEHRQEVLPQDSRTAALRVTWRF